MEFSISRSNSLGFSAISPHQNANPHQAKLAFLKPTRKLNYISSECSQFHLREKYSKIFSQKNESSSNLTPINKSYGRKVMPLIRAYAEVGGVKPAYSPLKKILDFGDVVLRFIRPYIVFGSLVGFTGVMARTVMENANAVNVPKWSIPLRGLAVLIGLLCADGYVTGINQIFDLDIDKINKPYLPLASGELSLRSGWMLTIGFVVIGVLMATLLKSPGFLAYICAEFVLGSIYSVPPFYTKRTTIGAILTCASMRGYVFPLGLSAAAKATLGLPFQLSVPVAFMAIFSTVFSLAIGLMKDLSDLEGDKECNVPTLATIVGVQKVAYLGFGILLLTYGGAISAALCLPQVFRQSVMIPAHIILASMLIFKALKLQKANYSTEESRSFYQFMWKLLDFEFLLFPFI